jgi:hypothetical protein
MVQSDHKTIARAFLARILWLQGFPDEAMRAGLSEFLCAGRLMVSPALGS